MDVCDRAAAAADVLLSGYSYAASNHAFDEDGSTYSRLDLTLRTYILGDRWQCDVTISGNSIHVVTDASLGGHGLASATIDARRP